MMIDDILCSRHAGRWFKDGATTWREGRKQRLATTRAEARQDRLRAIKVLRRHGKGRPEVRALICKLQACRPGQRCTSGACPECGRAMQRWFTQATADFVALQGGPVAVVHAVPAACQITEGSLS